MSRLVPDREWWTAEEIAEAKLPELPGTKRGVNLVVEREAWRSQAAFARRRAGKGGGWEYSWKLFPQRCRHKLLGDVAEAAMPERPERNEAWEWFEQQPASVQDKAKARLKIIQEVEAVELQDGKHVSVFSVARLRGVAPRTVWNWFAMIEGVRSDDRLPYLAPRHRASVRRGAQSQLLDCDPEFLDLIKADYLRLEGPPFTDCYRRAVRIAKKRGLDTLPERTMRRRLDASVSEATQILARKGVEALKSRYPTQVRDKTALGALEAVNGDFHKFDVFAFWPPAEGEKPVIFRPQMCAFQDIYSGRILAWRVDVTPNSTTVLLCAGDMITDWGIPEHVLLDNGREFAAKAITGGTSNRYRFKVKEDDIPGLFTALGCEIHWATPYSGQSKPIERAFRDLCQSISKDPRFAGAWTGNRPDAKPENYGSTAIPMDRFLEVVAEGIEEHNTRQGRRSEVAWGRSFAEVFDESYERRAIRKATEAQRRLWLLGAEGGRADSKTGAVWFQGNEFWDSWMGDVAGQRVIIRFDPADFWAGLHVYSAGGAYLGHAPVRQKTGFFDQTEGRAHARAKNAWLKAEKATLEAHRKMTALEVGQSLDALEKAAAPQVEAKVVRPDFGQALAAAKSARRGQPDTLTPEELERARAVVDITTRQQPPKDPEETDRDRFRRALELERDLEAGKPVTPDQQRWLSMIQATPAYRADRRLWEVHGDELFG